MSRNTEIDCLIRLEERASSLHSMIEFLAQEKVISTLQRQSLYGALKSELPHELHNALHNALHLEKLQLVDYIWTLLPTETICITIVSTHARQDFTWNY